jgi:hypothetical protein
MAPVADADAGASMVRADLTMMPWGGKERTAAEYETLLAQAGWRLTEVISTGTELSALEATPS